MIFSTTTTAQPWNKKSTVTFSAPIEIPGVGAQVLPAGTYVFRLLDSLSDRNIVQIFNKNESHLYATILAIPNYRLKATDKTVMTFAERAAGDPQAIRAWFYPGDNFGQEFVYPKDVAMEIATFVKAPVPVFDVAVDSDDALKTAKVEVVEPSGSIVEPVKVAAYVPPAPTTAPAAEPTA